MKVPAAVRREPAFRRFAVWAPVNPATGRRRRLRAEGRARLCAPPH
jgi:hypothetical protein